MVSAWKIRYSKSWSVILQVVLFCGILSQSASASLPGINGQVLFTTNRDGNDEIYAANYDGSNPRNLTQNSATDGGGAWSPDGLKIAFHSDRDGNYEIYTMKADGTDVQRITNISGTDALPTWSPDGTKLMFQTGRDGNDEIYSVNIDGTNPVNLTNYPANSDRDADTAGNGKIVLRQRTSSANIDIMNADGTGLTDVSGTLCGGMIPVCTNDDESQPTVSPDGTTVVFMGQGDQPSQQLYKVAVGSTSFTRLTTSASAQQNTPAFSADGQAIYYASDDDGDYEIFRMNSDGTNVVKITDNTTFTDNSPSIQPLTIYPTTTATSNQVDASSGAAVIINVLTRHSDAYGTIDPTSVAIVTPPTKGAAVVDNTSGTISYTPTTAALGPTGQNWLSRWLLPKAYAADQTTDSLTYKVCSTASSQLCTNTSLSFTLGASTLAPTGMNRDVVAYAALVTFATTAGVLLYRVTRKRQEIYKHK